VRFGKYQNWKVCPSNRCRAHCFCDSLFWLLQRSEEPFLPLFAPPDFFASEKERVWVAASPAKTRTRRPPRRNRHMTSTHCRSVALGRIIAPWAVKIAEFFGTIVKIILTIVENVRNSLHELGACCRQGYRKWSSCGEETAHSPSLPFSRCEAMGEGGRRPDEGSFPKSVAISTSIPAEIKSSHPPFGHPLPSLRTGEGKIGNRTPAENSHMRLPYCCREAGRRLMWEASSCFAPT